MKSGVILAAGDGSRAWPFCGIRQKATVPICNVPMVRRLALDLRAAGIEDLVVVTGHRAEEVRACLGDLDGVLFVEQPQRRGPVDAALHGLSAVSGDVTAVCFGDIATTAASLSSAVEAFEGRRANALLLTAPRPEGLTSSWTSIETARDGLLSGVGRAGPEHPRFAGVAIAKTEILKRYLERNPGILPSAGVGSMPPVEGDLAYTFDLMHADGIEVHTVSVTGFFVDVDKPWHIVEANYEAARDAFARMDKTVIGEGATIDDGADIAGDAKLHLGPGAHIGKGCHIEGSVVLGAGARVVNGAILGRGVTVGAHTRCEDYCKVDSGSVLGAHGVVGHCAEFSGVTFDSVYICHYSCITALIGTRVDIGAATVCGTWRFDDGTKPQVVAGHKEIPECYGECTFIGDDCRTGVNAMFMPGVKVGYYSCIGAGAIVYEDVPERTLLLPKQEQIQKPWGPERYGW